MNRHLHCRASLSVVGCLAVMLAVGCAEIGPPPGGEVDKTGPSLMASYPPIGALSVPSDNKIVLEFSEALVKPTGTPAVYLSPRPKTPPDIKVKGRRIEITLSEFFTPNQTYVVNVASELADARSNRLGAPVTVAFSTGPVIDSGVVSGVVLDAGKPVAQLLMGLFRKPSDSALPDFDSTYPEYTVTTNKDGQFELKYVPDGQYMLVGFRDKNKDERFNPAREQYCLPDRPIVTGGELALTALNLPLTSPDTTEVQLISAAATEDNLIRVRLAKAIPLALLGRRPELFVLTPLAQPADSIHALGFRESTEAQSSELAAWFGPLAKGAYRVEITYDTLLPPVVWDSLNFEPRTTTAKPDILAFLPENIPTFVVDVHMAMKFSEPIDGTALTDETFTLWDDSDARIPLEVNWSDPFHASFIPEQLSAGKKYRLLVSETDIKDVDGQALGDSLRTFEFSTLNADSLGSVSGNMLVQLPDRAASPVVLAFKAFGAEVTYGHVIPGTGPDTAPVTGKRMFSVDLPAGKYQLTAFVDQNNDGVRTTGVIAPFRYAETFSTYPDTVVVRARFETAGLTLDIE